MKRWQWVICVVLSAIAAWYGQQGLRETFQDQHHYLTSGAIAAGRAIRTRIDGSSLEMQFVFVVDGTEQFGDYYGRGGDFTLGEKIKVRYLRDNLLRPQVVGHEGYNDLYSMYGVLFSCGCAGLFFLTNIFLKKRNRGIDFAELIPSLYTQKENAPGVKPFDFDTESQLFQITILAAVFGILTTISIGFVLLTVPPWYKQNQFDQHSVATTAVITKISGFSSDGLHAYDVKFVYDVGGKQMEGSVPSLNLMQRLRSSTLQMRYLPENPHVLQLDGQEAFIMPPIPPIIFTIVFGLLTRRTVLRRKEFIEFVPSRDDFDETSPSIPLQQKIAVPIQPEDIPLNDLALNDLPLNDLPLKNKQE